MDMVSLSAAALSLGAGDKTPDLSSASSGAAEACGGPLNQVISGGLLLVSGRDVARARAIGGGFEAAGNWQFRLLGRWNQGQARARRFSHRVEGRRNGRGRGQGRDAHL
jgi:hypothetical protein